MAIFRSIIGMYIKKSAREGEIPLLIVALKLVKDGRS
jgi:hypothetical protein